VYTQQMGEEALHIGVASQSVEVVARATGSENLNSDPCHIECDDVAKGGEECLDIEDIGDWIMELKDPPEPEDIVVSEAIELMHRVQIAEEARIRKEQIDYGLELTFQAIMSEYKQAHLGAPFYDRLLVAEANPPSLVCHDDEEQSITLRWLGYSTRIVAFADFPPALVRMFLMFIMVDNAQAQMIESVSTPLIDPALIVAGGTAFKLVMDSCTNMIFYLGLLYLFRMVIMFGIGEYAKGKEFWTPIVANLMAWSTQEYQTLRHRWTLFNVGHLGITAFSALAGVSAVLYNSYQSSKIFNMYPQGARQDANRAGMFMTGLLSLCMLVMAPIIGAKKIVDYIRPVLDVLRQIPYASWIVDWLIKWSRGEVDFDDLPQDNHQWKEKMADNDAAEVWDEVQQVRQELKKELGEDNLRKTSKPKKTEPLSEEEKALFEEPDPEYLEKVDRYKKALYRIEDGENGTECIIYYNKGASTKCNRDDLDETFKGIYITNGSCGDITYKGAVWTYGELFEDDVIDELDEQVFVGQGYVSGKMMSAFYALSHGLLTVKNYMRKVAKGEIPDDANVQAEEFGKSQAEVQRDMEYEARKRGGPGDRDACEDPEPFVPDEETYLYKWFGDGDLTWDDVYEKCATGIVNAAKWVDNNKTKVAIIVAGVVAIGVALTRERDDEDYETAEPQGGKGKNKRGGRGAKRARYVKPNYQGSSGNEKEGYENAQDDYEDFLDEKENDRVNDIADSYYDQFEQPDDDGYSTYARGDDEQHRSKKKYKAWTTTERQGVSQHAKRRGKKAIKKEFLAQRQAKTPEVPILRDDSDIKRKIYASKKKIYRMKTQDIEEFISLARKKMEGQISKFRRQAWNPADKSSGVFKIFDDQGRYRCTGTLVGQRMYVVNHVMDESLTKVYTARNHVHNIQLDPSTFQIMNDEIGSFYTSGVPAIFKVHHLKVMEDAALVSIYGYGEGDKTSPDVITGFASPKGWCNAATRCGDCSAPALDVDGNIVGFWTHGNGKTFGRFEPITEEFIELAKIQYTVHTGLDFQRRPLSHLL
jgi:hypothetical protein